LDIKKHILPAAIAMTTSYVHSTHISATHSFSKTYSPTIQLIPGLGVHGDIHSGPTPQHTSQGKKKSAAPNLRQVHLIHGELFSELAGHGFKIQPGELGENVTTWGVDLLALPAGAYLYFGDGEGVETNIPVVQVTGLRDPGPGIERHAKGLLGKLLVREKGVKTVRKAGIMGIVVQGGTVKAGQVIRVLLPEGEQHSLKPV
jgi:MOSC domain-containing protein YiiM